jgi:hypothetical protein
MIIPPVSSRGMDRYMHCIYYVRVVEHEQNTDVMIFWAFYSPCFVLQTVSYSVIMGTKRTWFFWIIQKVVVVTGETIKDDSTDTNNVDLQTVKVEASKDARWIILW